jgi:hypothetical protein
MVEMIHDGSTMKQHPVEVWVLQGSPMSPILAEIYTSVLIKWAEEFVSEANGQSSVGDLGWVAA